MYVYAQIAVCNIAHNTERCCWLIYKFMFEKFDYMNLLYVQVIRSSLGTLDVSRYLEVMYEMCRLYIVTPRDDRQGEKLWS